MDTVPSLQPIPRPPGHLVVGNLFDLDARHPIESLMNLARKYGPIFQIEIPGRGTRIIVSGHTLVDELCDESRFDKMLGPGLKALAKGPVGQGLFTSETSDPKWRKGHNVLLPAFSGDAMRGYYPRMLDFAVQLTQKWERLNPDDTVDVPADMTRLTLDTIALCGFNYRSNLGTAEGLAHAIAEDARNRGFVATVGALDDHAGSLPKEGAVIVVTASYNGQPPDNAVKLCQWLQDPALPADAFAGVEYSVFGCGNRDWAATYQAIPTGMPG